MIKVNAPVILRMRQGNETDFVGARRRDDYFGGKVAFEFRSKAQYDRADEQITRRLYPLCSSSAFQALAVRMFGKENVKIDKTQAPGVALTRAQLEKLTDVGFLQRQIARHEAAGGDAPFMSPKSIAEMAKFITTATDKKGRTLFDLVDKQVGPGIEKPIKNGHLEVREAVNLFRSTTAQKREHIPSIMTGVIDGKMRTFGARDSWEFNATRTIEFDSRAQYDLFQQKLGELVPLFSSPDFAKVAGKLVGARAIKPEAGGVELRWTDMWKLRDPAAVEAAIRATSAKPIAGVDDPAEAARRIVALANYVVETDLNLGGDSAFGALSSVDGRPTLTTLDVKRLFRDTARAAASLQA